MAYYYFSTSILRETTFISKIGFHLAWLYSKLEITKSTELKSQCGYFGTTHFSLQTDFWCDHWSENMQQHNISCN